MKILYGYNHIKENLKSPVVAIGVFDGVHIGHRKIIKKVVNLHKKLHDRAVMTFDPHPEAVLRHGKTPPRIMSLEHRLSIFRKMGLDAVIVINFTPFIAEMSPEKFIKTILVDTGIRKVYVGTNFYFGRAKAGSVETLKTICKKYGIDVVIVSPVKRRGRIVSSTWLRKLITAGNIEEAEKLLRRPVSVLGKVVKGQNLGTILGVPTANIDPHQEVIPPAGVYAVKVFVGDRLYDGVLNIGFKPTFYGSKLKRRKEPHIEVHVIGFEGNLYGQLIEVFFIKKLRREKRFGNIQKLKNAIRNDIQKAKALLAKSHPS